MNGAREDRYVKRLVGKSLPLVGGPEQGLRRPCLGRYIDAKEPFSHIVHRYELTRTPWGYRWNYVGIR